MPVLTNPRHERFAQELAKGKTATEAYALAGYKPNDGNAATLKGNQRVSARVAELQGAVAKAVVEETALTRADLLKELRKLVMAGSDDPDVRPSVKRAAIADYAKIEGWMIDRAEVGQPGDFERMTDAEVLEALSAEASQIGLPIPKGKTSGRTNGNGTTH